LIGFFYFSIFKHTLIDGRQRKNIEIGLFVEIVQKQNQRSGALNQGKVSKILTKSVSHPYGIKVQLESGLVGRVQNVIE
tara:strand:+ start:934 stop:1170 length:237 start_codon:yes stop_codon:yes gene_type:complete